MYRCMMNVGAFVAAHVFCCCWGRMLIQFVFYFSGCLLIWTRVCIACRTYLFLAIVMYQTSLNYRLLVPILTYYHRVLRFFLLPVVRVAYNPKSLRLNNSGLVDVHLVWWRTRSCFCYVFFFLSLFVIVWDNSASNCVFTL